uniref:Putative secreted protein n=1 Tax=Anopheles triannulatus TaxID=58253 RepID=A0A2M4B4N4_9DIPT
MRLYPPTVRVILLNHVLFAHELDLFAAPPAWHVPCDEKLFIFGKIGFDFAFIADGPGPGWAVVRQVVTGSNKLLRCQHARFPEFRFL